MKHYIIDGNNLIGKVKSVSAVHTKNKQMSREVLAYQLDRFFDKKKVKVSLHFDGFKNEPINTSNLKIIYSDNQTADEKIKDEIDIIKNKRIITVVSSDLSVREYAKVNGCEIITSEDFDKLLLQKNDRDEEKSRSAAISNEEIKRLFGAE